MDKLIQQFEELKVNVLSKGDDDSPIDKEMIETYLKSVFDFTLYYENYLTENNFKLDSSMKDVDTIVNLLNSVVTVCYSFDKMHSFFKNHDESCHQSLFAYYDPITSVVNILGIEYAECILWRQGSILYAFCCTKLNSDPEWVADYQVNVLNYLKDGIDYFRKMLHLPKEITSLKSNDNNEYIETSHFAKLNDTKIQEVIKGLSKHMFDSSVEIKLNQTDMTTNSDDQPSQSSKGETLTQSNATKLEEEDDDDDDEDDDDNDGDNLNADVNMRQNTDTLELIKLGIKSDAHLLAIMYCGQMCFWYCKYSVEWRLMDRLYDKELLDEMKSIGTNFLKIYVDAVERILQFAGWNCEQAKELLNLFTQI